MNENTQLSIVEALVLASPEPVTARRLAEACEGLTPSKIAKIVARLNDRYMEAASAFRIRELAGGFQYYIIPEFSGYVDELFKRQRKLRLTRAALETLAIIAYRQPVIKTDIEQIRGVASDGVIHNLLEKGLITVSGRSEGVGRSLQYGTTNEFLKFFGLGSLDDLPRMSEIEELVRASEPQAQTRLELVREPENPDNEKLNIADGTYNPEGDPDDSTGHEDAGSETSHERADSPADEKATENETEQEQSGIIVDVDTT